MIGVKGYFSKEMPLKKKGFFLMFCCSLSFCEKNLNFVCLQNIRTKALPLIKVILHSATTLIIDVFYFIFSVKDAFYTS